MIATRQARNSNLVSHLEQIGENNTMEGVFVMPKNVLIDLTGQKFVRLTVISEAGRTKAQKAVWLCRCECGNEKLVVGGDLRSGRTKSCGCLMRETTIKRSTKHGHRHEPIYHIWLGMKARCENPKDDFYKDYGGRGIKVCKEWHDFQTFYDDFGKLYKPGLSVDRIDVNGNYEPGNCRWATPVEQANNTRSNVFYIVDGVKDTMANHCRRYNVNYSAVLARITRLNWDVEKAFKTPIHELGYNGGD